MNPFGVTRLREVKETILEQVKVAEKDYFNFLRN